MGDVLLWVALPQFLLAPTVAWFLNHVDPRRLQFIGMICLIITNLCASFLTSDWAEGNFVVWQLLQAIGQASVLISLIFVVVRGLTPDLALPFGAMLQTVRLFGGEPRGR